MTLQNTIIYLIGFSGTGKLTIAKAIACLAPVVIIDNQLINDPVFTAIEADGKSAIPLGVWMQASVIRKAVLETVRFYGRPESNFIFTNELFERETGDSKLYHSIESLAAYRNSLFIPVRLLCQKEELLHRVVGEDRNRKRKCIDPKSVADKFDNHEVLQPLHPNVLQLDVTALTPGEAASQIHQHIRRFQK